MHEQCLHLSYMSCTSIAPAKLRRTIPKGIIKLISKNKLAMQWGKKTQKNRPGEDKQQHSKHNIENYGLINMNPTN